MKSVCAADLLNAARACEALADASDVQQQRRAEMEVLAHLEAVRLGAMLAKLQRLSATPHGREALPLVVEGDEIGRVESRIPKDVFFHLARQRNFGWEGLTSDEGQRDLLRAWPQFRVRTVSGRPQVGYRRATARRWHFGRGTLDLKD